MAAPRHMTPEQRTERARQAARARWDREEAQQHRRDYLEATIARLVENAPPLGPEQTARLRALLQSQEETA